MSLKASMPRRERLALLLLAFLVLGWPGRGSAAAEAEPSRWAVIGLHHPDAPGVGPEVEALREALATVIGAAGGLPPAETALRLGAPPQGQDMILHWLEQAELHLFQLQIEEAESFLRRAIDALRGQPGPWVRDELRRAHLLLATLHLVRSGPEAPAAVIEAWLPLARVRAEVPLDSRIPADLLPLLREARLVAEGEAHGWLRFDCEESCAGTVVLADSFPVGPPGMDLPLPAGRYRVLLHEAREGGGRSSLPREVEVRAGEMSRVRLDWRLEASLDRGGGPAWRVREEAAEAVAELAARWLGVERLWGVLRPAGPERELELWVREEKGMRRRTVARDASGAIDWEAEVRALSEAVPAAASEARPVPLAAAGGAEAGEAQRELPPYLASDPPPSRNTSMGLDAARWLGATASVVAWGAGGWLHYDADRRSGGLEAMQLAPGHFASNAQARAYNEEAASIRRQQHWGSAALVGAAALSLGTLLLFVIEE